MYFDCIFARSSNPNCPEDDEKLTRETVSELRPCLHVPESVCTRKHLFAVAVTVHTYPVKTQAVTANWRLNYFESLRFFPMLLPDVSLRVFFYIVPILVVHGILLMTSWR